MVGESNGLLKARINGKAFDELNKDTQRSLVMRARDRYLNWQYDAMDWMDEKAVGRWVVEPLVGATEETLEEVTENTMYSFISRVYNSVDDEYANVYRNKYAGMSEPSAHIPGTLSGDPSKPTWIFSSEDDGEAFVLWLVSIGWASPVVFVISS